MVRNVPSEVVNLPKRPRTFGCKDTPSIEEFVETVARNYDTIREGSVIADNQTYLLEISDEHNNTLFIQLSRDGSYWNVNSAGILIKNTRAVNKKSLLDPH